MSSIRDWDRRRRTRPTGAVAPQLQGYPCRPTYPRENRMKAGALVLAFGMAAMVAAAADAKFGTSEEARAMLKRVEADLKKDKAATLQKMKNGDEGFKDRDLYPFCIGPDGKTTAHASRERIGEQ